MVCGYFTRIVSLVNSQRIWGCKACQAVDKSQVFDVFEKIPGIGDGKIEGPKDLSVLSVVSPVLEPGGKYIDLTTEDVRVGKEIHRKSREIMKTGILSMTALLLFCVAILSNVLMKNMYLNRLEHSYVRENEEVLKLSEVMDSTAKVKRFIFRKGTGLSGLAVLFKAMPPEVFLTSIDFKEEDVFTLTGTAQSMSMVFSLVTELENLPDFKDLKVDFTRSRNQRGSEVADFGLTLTYERGVV